LRFFPKAGAALRYATVNWLSTLGAAAPTFIFPLLVALHVSSFENARFYIAWSVASMVLLVPVVIGQALLVEAGRDDSDIVAQTRVATMASGLLMATALLGSAFSSKILVSIYGANYGSVGHTLTGLLIAGLPWSITAICLTEVRARKHTGATIGITVALPIAVLIPTSILIVTRGVPGAIVGWTIGNFAGAAISLLLVRLARRQTPPSSAGTIWPVAIEGEYIAAELSGP
jgi:O-antigen/teichoic acid export membrane protein